MSTHPAVDDSHKTVTPPCQTHGASPATQTRTPEPTAAKDMRITTTLVFRVHSVEKTEAPGGGQGHDWYRYVLKNHKSTINGFRRGSRQLVSDYAAQYAEQLNMRTLHGPTPWSQRGNKNAPRTR